MCGISGPILIMLLRIIHTECQTKSFLKILKVGPESYLRRYTLSAANRSSPLRVNETVS